MSRNGARMDPTINTLDQRLFNYENPSFEGFSVEGLSLALSKLCRFTGHTRGFYSVAEHCVLVSRMLPREIAVYGLVHDLHEAVMGDVNSPLKSMIPDYKAIENKVEAALMDWLGLIESPEIRAAVKRADTLAYLAERTLLLPPLPPDHPEHGYIVMPEKGTEERRIVDWAMGQIHGGDWDYAHDKYMRRVADLTIAGSVLDSRVEMQR